MRKSYTVFLIVACAVFASAPADDVPKGMARIPAGSFMMGSADGEDDEKPVHEVHVDAFYMDKYEVTVAQFKQFVDATGYKTDAEEAGWSFAWTGTLLHIKEEINWRHDGRESDW